jgi:pimeloyl-ACP methyl ester carboxylesterase
MISFRLSRRAVTGAVLTVAGVAWLGVTTADAGTTTDAATGGARGVNWKPCPQYSDDVIRTHVPADQVAAYRARLNRMECGTVRVPLDYRNPNGRQIDVAVTRLKATDRARRRGTMVLNPGGPGASGYLMPADIMSFNDENTHLNDRYDLIGFDPRGIGYSTTANCPSTGGARPAGPLTRDAAQAIYDQQVAATAACANSDLAFLSQLTTANVARDLDRIRAGLGERKLSFLGVSWGTSLGVVYRSAFPARTDRMFLDSVAPAQFRGDVFAAETSAATERGFGRMAAWLARHNDTYGFGTTAAEVSAAVRALVARYDADPKRYTDLPIPVDGSIVAANAGKDSRFWPASARALVELRDSTGDTAPPTIKQQLGPAPAPPAGSPERLNPTMNRANACNHDAYRPDFATAWAGYQALLTANPVTGRAIPFTAGCTGWPVPAQPHQLRSVRGSLVLSGHLDESMSVYKWTPQMRAEVGGQVYTVGDDVHGSALRACSSDVVAYFNTGHIDSGCDGAPRP